MTGKRDGMGGPFLLMNTKGVILRIEDVEQVKEKRRTRDQEKVRKTLDLL